MTKKIIPLSRFVTGIVILGWSLLVQADENPDASRSDFNNTISLGIESFRWQEFDARGQRLLTEQGPRMVLGTSFGNANKPDAGFLYGFEARFYTGTVDYDGQDQLGVFVATDTSYRGVSVEWSSGYRFILRKIPSSIDLVFALGADEWERDIRGSVNALGFSTGGIVEKYKVDYGKIGVGFLWPHQMSSSYFQIGAKKPVSTVEDVEIFNVSLSPGKKWSAYAAYTLKSNRERLGAPFVRFYYDSFRFSRSPSKPFGAGVVWQPESSLDIFGVTFGYAL